MCFGNFCGSCPFFFPLIGFLILLIGIYLIVNSPQKRKISQKDSEKPADEDSLEILRKRYAKGEISKDEYNRMKDELES